MASLTALLVLVVPITIGVIPPIDYKTDKLLFNIGLISVLVGVCVISIWVFQSVDDWIFRLSKHSKRRE
ncbi:hypothetical protein [Glutamicibacter sp. AOP5-A2-18]|uniref:hypothetical protein n=1 Tax=Glutamicibacter sp. AOP5-A2-18 TaxID=3457656 RepID=UPI004033B904